MTYVPGSVAADIDADFSVGSVFERSFSILFRNLVPLLILGGIAAIPYIFIFAFQADSQPIAGAKPTFAPALAIGMVASLAAAFTLRPLCQAVILFGAFQDMRGRKFPLGESLQKGLTRFFPIVGMLFCEGVGILIGFILLIVPGYILLIAWYAALSACVVEKLGPIESLRRSAQLTKGHRWKIFGVLIVIGMAGGAFSAISSAVLGSMHNRTALIIGQYIMQSLLIAFEALVGVVIYHDLRAAKEGIDTERIAAVFD